MLSDNTIFARRVGLEIFGNLRGFGLTGLAVFYSYLDALGLSLCKINVSS